MPEDQRFDFREASELGGFRIIGVQEARGKAKARGIVGAVLVSQEPIPEREETLDDVVRRNAQGDGTMIRRRPHFDPPHHNI